MNATPTSKNDYYTDKRYHLDATWAPPSGVSRSTIDYYTVNYSRPPISENIDGWSKSYRTQNTRHRIRTSYKCATWTVIVTAHSTSGVSQRAIDDTSIPDCPPDPPKPRVSLEGRSWWFDDPDAVISWSPASGATHYVLDWRYTGEDRQPVHRNRISGNSKPSGGSDAEILFNISDRIYTDIRPDKGSRHGWNPKDRTYRIHSNQEQYVLEVRMQAWGSGGNAHIGDPEWVTEWSKWIFHPRSVLSAGCKAYQIYNEIRDFVNAVDTINAILTIGSIAGAVFTAGSSLTGLAAKQAIKEAAKQMVSKVLTKRAARIFLKELVQEVIVRSTDAIADNLESKARELAMIFACITFATNGDKWQQEHALQLANDVLREFMTREDFSSLATSTVIATVGGALPRVLTSAP